MVGAIAYMITGVIIFAAGMLVGGSLVVAGMKKGDGDGESK